MNFATRLVCFALVGFALARASAQDLPQVRIENGASQILVHGKPFLMLAGELGNSSSGTAAEADSTLPRLAQLHFNTVLMPVAWNQIEPQEGHFDFSIPDHWIEFARQQHLHLVLLWFGSWKNAFSEYAPAWVLSDPKRFPRALSSEGLPLEILSPLGQETARADARAFTALMAHLRERDATQQTVLMVQVENEVGYLGIGGRDRSPEADQQFQAAVPAQLAAYLRKHPAEFSPRLARRFNPGVPTWREMFGDGADEAFMAWQYGLFVHQVAAAGKQAYPLPLYMNAQLPAPLEQPGEYPGGGPHPDVQAIYRAAAPAIDFYAPDIYWPDFSAWVDRYKAVGNPVFIPEARLDVAPWNALYTFGEARGFGFSPFAVDSISVGASPSDGGPAISNVYATLAGMSDTILDAQQKNHIRALVLDDNSPRPSQTIALGGYLFRASLARTWPARQLAASHGAMMVIQTEPGQFLIIGCGLTVSFFRDPDTDNQLAGIASVDQGTRLGDGWATERRLNGDQTDQGRALQTDAHEIRVYRVNLYAYSRKN